MMEEHKTTTGGIELLEQWYVDGSAEMQVILDDERKNATIARRIFSLRQKAGLSQQELARLAGTTASVIYKIEDADCDGHSIAMLRRIAAALGRTLELKLVPAKR